MIVDNVEYRIAETRDDLEGAMRLVYDNYQAIGYCPRNQFGLHVYLYDALPETRTLVALRDGQVIATLTLVFDSPFGLPSDHLYHVELDALRLKERRLCEVSKLSMNRDLRARSIPALMQLFRLAWITTQAVRNTTDLIILIEPHHENFYGKLFQAERIGEFREDPDAKGAPSLLLRVDQAQALATCRQRFGGQRSERNLDWFIHNAPDCAMLYAEAFAADTRLNQMHTRVNASVGSSSASVRRYIDFRRFTLRFNSERITEQAIDNAQSGRFRKTLGLYEQLMSILPTDHEPEAQADVLLEMARATWHCGLYERTLSLDSKARQLATDPDRRASSHLGDARALHSLERDPEAHAALRTAAAIPGISAFSRAQLFECESKIAIDGCDLTRGADCLMEAHLCAVQLPDSPAARTFRFNLAFARIDLEKRLGNKREAIHILDDLAMHCPPATDNDRLGVVITRISLEYERGDPRSALTHADGALQLLNPESTPFRAALFHGHLANSLYASGRIDAARQAASEALALARKSRRANALVFAAGILFETDLASDRDDAAAGWLARIQEAAQQSSQTRMKAISEHTRALLAVERRRWDEARQACNSALELSSGEPYRHALFLLLRTQIELRTGDLPTAAARFAYLPTPGQFPEGREYEAGWHTVQAVLAIGGKAPASAVQAWEDLHLVLQQQEALMLTADNTLLLADALAACRLLDQGAALLALCSRWITAIAAATSSPRLQRRLHEPPFQTAGAGAKVDDPPGFIRQA